MAVNIITSGFLLLVLVAGVHSAKVELGGDCISASDQCVSTLAELVCDTPLTKPNGVCRVKSGQPCKKSGGLCVIGAECVSDSCVCQGGYSTVTAFQCTPPAKGFYVSCTTASADCGGVGALAGIDVANCGAKAGCACASGTTVPIYTDGTCAALANSMVGQACTSANAATNCGLNSNTHLSCVDTMCACDAGYFPTKTPGGTCVINAASTVGIVCTVGSTPSACTGQNEECVASKCACKSGFTAKPGGVCYAAWGTLKGGCSVNGDCGALKCTSYDSGPMTCKTELAADGDCSDPTEKVCASGLTCTANKCAKTVVQVSGSCANTATTVCATGLICDANVCKTELTTVGADCSVANTKCTTGLTCGADNKCKLADDYNGGACTTEPATAFARGSCTSGTNTVCGAATGAAGICVCQQGYEGVAPKACAITANMFGASCTTGTVNTKGTCGDVSLVCSATTGGTCVCATAAGYSGGSNGDVCKSANSLGGACTSGSCTDTNAECSGSVCRCKTDYVQSFFTSKCVLGAGGTTDCTGLTCVEGSTCTGTTPRCTCDTGKAPWTVNTKICLPSTANVLGGTCTITTTEAANTEKGTCTDANGRCRRDIGFCTCKDGYTASNFGQTCHASDAMMITTSSLLITLAAVISQLFVR